MNDLAKPLTMISNGSILSSDLVKSFEYFALFGDGDCLLNSDPELMYLYRCAYAATHSHADNYIYFSNLKINFPSSIRTPQQALCILSVALYLFVPPQTPFLYRYPCTALCCSLSCLCVFLSYSDTRYWQLTIHNTIKIVIWSILFSIVGKVLVRHTVASRLKGVQAHAHTHRQDKQNFIFITAKILSRCTLHSQTDS